MQTVWQRIKTPDKGWRYSPVKEGRGKRTSELQPPFYVRPRINGKQTYQRLIAQTFAEARQEADRFTDVLAAAAKGLTVAEAETIANLNRTTVKSMVDVYLAQKSSKAPKTV